MSNFTNYLAGFLCLFLTNTFAQVTFEDRAKSIANKIETITKEEKQSLKDEIEKVNDQLEKGDITASQADEQKLQLAEKRAKNIETRSAEAQEELKELVQEKVDGKITEKDSTRKFMISFPDMKKKDKYKKTR